MNRTYSWMLLSAVFLAGISPAAAITPQGSTHSAARPTPAVPSTALPARTPEINRTLKAMRNASTWGHPDLYGEFTGMGYFYNGNYKAAMKYFKYGARYADKLSQAMIGLMYLNGRGVKPDEATACAWLTVAAQREYPRFVFLRTHVCGALTPAQRTRAKAKMAKLLPVYGDEVAKPRMSAVLLEHWHSRNTSYMKGNVNVSSLPAGYLRGFAQSTFCANNGVKVAGMVLAAAACGGFVSDKRYWIPKLYFALRAARWTGKVTVGPLKNVKAPASGASH